MPNDTRCVPVMSHLTVEEAERIDGWRAQFRPILSRSKAISELTALALDQVLALGPEQHPKRQREHGAEKRG